MPAEAQGVGQGGADVLFRGRVLGTYVQVALLVRDLVAHGGGEDAVPQGQGGRAMASTAPAAPSMWPVMDLVELRRPRSLRRRPGPF